MSYSISLILDLKKNSNTFNIEELIKNIAHNCNSCNNYDDYNLDGINKYIRTNEKIMIFEFDEISELLIFLEIIITIKEIKIEYIYYENSLIYASKKYLNNLDKNLFDKKQLEFTIEKNKNNYKYKNIYNIIKV